MTTLNTLAIRFKRTHIPTGNVYEGEFDSSHGWEFTQDLIDRHNRAAAVRRAGLKVEQWNKQQPEEWRYVLCLN